MSFVVEVVTGTKIKQGLLAPARGRPVKTVSKAADEPKAISGHHDSFEIVIKVGVMFTDKQLKKSGIYVDSDDLQLLLQKQADYLASATWTDLFDFRPTFENVSKWLCETLKKDIKQLEYVELENKTLGVTTQYIP